jgi:hypothetical protein
VALTSSREWREFIRGARTAPITKSCALQPPACHALPTHPPPRYTRRLVKTLVQRRDRHVQLSGRIIGSSSYLHQQPINCSLAMKMADRWRSSLSAGLRVSAANQRIGSPCPFPLMMTRWMRLMIRPLLTLISADTNKCSSSN